MKLTGEETPLPPPFIVGGVYEDEISKYKVLSLEGSRMTLERLDSTRGFTDNISLKASIHRRRVLERQRPGAITYRELKTASGTATSEYKYEVVTPLVAGIIDRHSKRSTEWLPHARLKKVSWVTHMPVPLLTSFSLGHHVEIPIDDPSFSLGALCYWNSQKTTQ